jgi:hypothetical protein
MILQQYIFLLLPTQATNRGFSDDFSLEFLYLYFRIFIISFFYSHLIIPSSEFFHKNHSPMFFANVINVSAMRRVDIPIPNFFKSVSFLSALGD